MIYANDVVIFTQVTNQESGITYNSENGQFVVGTTGTYLVSFTVNVNYNTDAVQFDVEISNPSSTIVFGNNAGAFEGVSGSCIVQVNANGTIQLKFVSDPDVLPNIFSGSSSMTIIQIA